MLSRKTVSRNRSRDARFLRPLKYDQFCFSLRRLKDFVAISSYIFRHAPIDPYLSYHLILSLKKVYLRMLFCSDWDGLRDLRLWNCSFHKTILYFQEFQIFYWNLSNSFSFQVIGYQFVYQKWRRARFNYFWYRIQYWVPAFLSMDQIWVYFPY